MEAVSICKLSIDSFEDSLSSNGKLLKKIFLSGLSNSIISLGKIEVSDYVEETSKSDEVETSDDKSQENDNKTEQPTDNKTDDSQEVNNQTNNQNVNNDSLYRRNYSILESYLRLVNDKFINNEAKPKHKKKKKNKKIKGKQNKKEEPKENSEETKQETEEEPKQETEEEPKQEPEETNNFSPGDKLEVKIELKDEGYTTWVIQLDSSSNKESVITALKNKKLKNAFFIASKDSEADGLIPLSIETFLYKRKDECPYFGYCRYAFGVTGLSDNSRYSSDSKNDEICVCLAIAPINSVKNKPDENIVYKRTYNISGDITEGKSGSLTQGLIDFLDKTNDVVQTGRLGTAIFGDDSKDKGDTDLEDDLGKQLQKFLENKFSTVGDHTMYKDFLKIRKFINDQLSKKNLVVGDSSDNETVQEFSKISGFKDGKFIIRF